MSKGMRSIAVFGLFIICSFPLIGFADGAGCPQHFDACINSQNWPANSANGAVGQAIGAVHALCSQILAIASRPGCDIPHLVDPPLASVSYSGPTPGTPMPQYTVPASGDLCMIDCSLQPSVSSPAPISSATPTPTSSPTGSPTQTPTPNATASPTNVPSAAATAAASLIPAPFKPITNLLTGVFGGGSPTPPPPPAGPSTGGGGVTIGGGGSVGGVSIGGTVTIPTGGGNPPPPPPANPQGPSTPATGGGTPPSTGGITGVFDVIADGLSGEQRPCYKAYLEAKRLFQRNGKWTDAEGKDHLKEPKESDFCH